jgi:hypothetical protein
MLSLDDFNIATPRNRTQSSNHCGIAINNHISNYVAKRGPKNKKEHQFIILI